MANSAAGPVVALVGNPNVGKSTVFNALTNLHQHTGNWPGKTVSTARGTYTYRDTTYTLVDLPGTYSLHPGSAEEEVTRDYLLTGEADVTLVVVDATCLARNLALVLQILEIAWPVVVCVNLLDEAAKKHIRVDLAALESRLGCPVVGTAARSGRGLDALRRALEEAVRHPGLRPARFTPCPGCEECEDCRAAATMARAAATSVGNATTSNIFISDTAGNTLFSGDEDYTLTGSTISQIEAQNAAESYIRSKVKQALLGTGLFETMDVATFLKFDYSEYEETRHNYMAQDGREEGLIGHQSVEESESTGGTANIPGTDSNDEDDYMLDLNGATSSSSSATDTDRVLDETIMKILTPAGIIDYDNSSLTVTARSFDVVYEEVIERQGLLDVMTWEEYKANNSASSRMEVDDDFYDAVATATGISRDKITIIAYRENLFFDKEGLNVNWTDILSIVMIVIILALLAFVILRSMVSKKDTDQEEELSVENLLQSTPDSELEDIEVESKSDTRKLIERFVDENPEAVASLLRNWLNEDWG